MSRRRLWAALVCLVLFVFFVIHSSLFFNLRKENSSDCIKEVRYILNISPPSGSRYFDLYRTRSIIKDRVNEACAKIFQEHDNDVDRMSDPLCFKTVFTPGQRRVAARHLQTVSLVLSSAHVEYFMDMGTALGSYRHLGMIPYDDDLDLRVNIKEKDGARSALLRLHRIDKNLLFQDTEWKNQHWKVHMLDLRDPDTKKPRFIDIFFYRVEDEIVRVAEPPYLFNGSDVFPLHFRPFEGVWLPAPRKINNLLLGYFPGSHIGQCVYYQHKGHDKSNCTQPVVPCTALSYRIPFVHRLSDEFGTLEFLYIRGKIIRVAYIPNL